MKLYKLSILEIVLIVISLVLAMFVFAGYKDTQFLKDQACQHEVEPQSTTECKLEVLQCKQMNKNSSQLLKGEILNVKIR